MPEWLSAIVHFFTAWCPRFHRVPPTHRLVKWSRCRTGTLHGPGIVWYWPLLTEIEDVDIRFKSCVSHVQSITLSDGTPVSARAMTLWKPNNPLQAIEENEDYADRVAETALSCVVDVLSPMPKEMLCELSALNQALTDETRTQLDECGIEVKRCKFTELVVARPFRLINDAC